MTWVTDILKDPEALLLPAVIYMFFAIRRIDATLTQSTSARSKMMESLEKATVGMSSRIRRLEQDMQALAIRIAVAESRLKEGK
jgi:hypothetical protein